MSPYLVKLVIFDIIPVLLIFCGKLITQLMCGGKNRQVCVQIIPGDKREKGTKIGGRLTKLSQKIA